MEATFFIKIPRFLLSSCGIHVNIIFMLCSPFHGKLSKQSFLNRKEMNLLRQAQQAH